MIIYWTAFVLGLGSSLHCMGMCGPLALAIPVDRSSKIKSILGILQYNFGRIVSYAILGILVGFIGLSVALLGVLQTLSIVAGCLMILFAWKKWFFSRLEQTPIAKTIQRFVSKSMGKILRSHSPFKLFLLGSINGLLPCGMVYLALMNALLTGNSYAGALAMALFGLGTLPAMVLVAFAANRVSNGFRRGLQRAVPLVLTLVGILVVLRGLNLDIPYVSPKITVAKTQEVQKGSNTPLEAEVSCCHPGKKACSK